MSKWEREHTDNCKVVLVNVNTYSKIDHGHGSYFFMYKKMNLFTVTFKSVQLNFADTTSWSFVSAIGGRLVVVKGYSSCIAYCQYELEMPTCYTRLECLGSI